eukprot:gb/GFBE01064511.1/.p1 GENE.gb/GFBE01064511.1/~~gb/GFBE01064511.1/.p1  ORF type:complete len:315 (+),score=48.64 gb/GFBE01064511.1/:1-945(+)
MEAMVEGTTFEDGATAIMLRGLPAEVTTRSLCSRMDAFASCKYDFVYVPCDRVRKKSIGLAYVNFVDHASAKLAFEVLTDDSKMSTSPWSTPRVLQARTQGLGPNLAFFLVKAGHQNLQNPDAPQVFENGVRVPNLANAVRKHVTHDILRKMMEEVEKRRGVAELGRISEKHQRSPESVPLSKIKARMPRTSPSPCGGVTPAKPRRTRRVTFAGSLTIIGEKGDDGMPTTPTCYLNAGGKSATCSPFMQGSGERLNECGSAEEVVGSGALGEGARGGAKATHDLDNGFLRDLGLLGVPIRFHNLPDDIVAVVRM